MGNKHNEDVLYGKPNSILIGDGVPQGSNIRYRKGDLIINVGKKMEKEPMYICVESGTPGKWMSLQAGSVIQEAPEVEDTQVDTVTFNNTLATLVAEFSKLPSQDDPLDVDLSETYMSIATIDDPGYIEAEKEVSFDGINLAKTCKLSIGNNNFIEFEQYKEEGNEMQLSLFTLAVAGDSEITIAADGYQDINFNVTMENPVEAEFVVHKGANWQNDRYNLNKIGENEYELELLQPLKNASWNEVGTAFLVFEFVDKDGNNLYKQGGQIVTKRVENGIDVRAGVEEVKQFTAEDGSKDYRGFIYVYAYDEPCKVEYTVALLDGACKPQKITIHVPANKVD